MLIIQKGAGINSILSFNYQAFLFHKFDNNRVNSVSGLISCTISNKLVFSYLLANASAIWLLPAFSTP